MKQLKDYFLTKSQQIKLQVFNLQYQDKFYLI